MSSARLDRLLRAASVRLALVYAALLAMAFVVAGVAAWLATKAVAEAEVREHVELEMAAVLQEWRTEGLPAALAEISAHRRGPGALEYCVWDDEGRALRCDLGIAQPPLGWGRIALSDAAAPRSARGEVLVLARQTPAGGVLAVADNLLRAQRGRAAVLDAILGVGALALVLALAAGVFAARGTLRRMDVLSSTLARVGAGDFSARAPEVVGGDDIDAMARGLNQMLARIDILVANTRRVSADIAHDLRTPLTHVRQQLEAAAAAPDSGALQEAVRVAQIGIDDVLRTFAAMLRLAEIDAGAARRRFAATDLASLVERVAGAYGPDVEASGHSLRVENGAVGLVDGDADLIVQALANLLENAMRHAGANAVIVVRLKHSTTEIRLEVEDNGVGVPAADRTRIAEPFVRLDPSRAPPGAGLGLSIVAAIARLHGADLRLQDAAPGLRAVLAWPAKR